MTRTIEERAIRTSSRRDLRRIAVIGAGALGTSVAYHLAREGAQVLLLEAAPSGGGGVTKDSFGWIGLSTTAPDEEQAALRRLASDDLDRIETELPLPISLRRNGALLWSAEQAEPGGALIVDRHEIQRLEPSLLNPPASAVFAEHDGSVDPVALTMSFLRGAQELGAELSAGTKVHEVLVSNGKVTGLRTSGGRIDIDTVVLTAGTETTGLAHTAGVRVPVAPSPCILMRFNTPIRLLNRIVSGPQFELRQATDTVLLAAEDYIDDSPENGPDALAQRTLTTIHREIAGSQGVTLTNVSVGHRPIPEDRRPIVGRAAEAKGLYVATAHAAIALSAGLGRLAAEEIVHGRRFEILEPFRPARFATD